MPSWEARIRAAAAREEREALRRRRELERLAKERAKLSALEQAKLEVDAYNNQIEVLLSVHKEQTDAIDWTEMSASLPPTPPRRLLQHELRAKQNLLLNSKPTASSSPLADEADTREFEMAKARYVTAIERWKRLTDLADRVRSGNANAYEEALNEFSPLTEISHFGSSMDFTVHSARLIECSLTVKASSALPTEVKTLTAGGKVSVKAMPRTQFHDLYQDYVCSCILRVAREVFAVLPIETLLLTASTSLFDSATGHASEKPVLSVSVTAKGLLTLNFDRLDPSDAIEGFLHRGDFKASRKTGGFLPITPMTVADISHTHVATHGLRDLIDTGTRLRGCLTSAITQFGNLSSQ